MTILVVGDANADLTATLARFPHEGDDSTVATLSWGSGGSAANAAIALVRMGAAARLLARVGCDPAAQVALQAARDGGVDLSVIQIDQERATGLCYAAITPGGERTFFAFRGANVALELPELSTLLAGVVWVHLSGHALIEGTQRRATLTLIDEASRRNVPVSLDLCLPLLRASRAETLALLPRLAVLFANQHELCLLAAGAPERPDLTNLAGSLYQHGTRIVVGKCGPQGCIVADSAGARPVPGFAVEALDSNGCGDAFAAGFLAAQLAGATADQSARMGNACGALAATRQGAAEALPYRAAVEAFLATQGRVAEEPSHHALS
jgi:ribokinase